MSVHTYKDIQEEKFTPLKWEDFDRYWTIDYIETDIPTMRFQWLPYEMAFVSLKQGELLKAKGVEITPADKPITNKEVLVWGTTRKDPKRNLTVRWFCNLARTGWYWTKDPLGNTDYQGVSYGNWEFVGLTAKTPEQVIRETMLVAIAKMDVPSELKYHACTIPLWKNMVYEAIENQTVAARFAVENVNAGSRTCIVNGVRCG